MLQVLRVAQMVHARQQGPKQLAVRRDSAHRNAAETHAVVALLSPDQAHPLPLAAHPMPGNRNLQRRIDRLRTGIGEEHTGYALRRDFSQPVGQFKGARIAHLKGRVVIQLGRLLLNGRDDVRMAVSRIAAPQPRHAVEHLPPSVRRVIHALGFGNEAGVALELTVRRKRHPIRLQIGQVVGHIFVRIHGPVAYQPKAPSPTPLGTRASCPRRWERGHLALDAGNEGILPSTPGTRASCPRRGLEALVPRLGRTPA